MSEPRAEYSAGVKAVEWQPCTIALADLIPWERNPKTISKSHAKRLLELWNRLGQFQTIAIGPDNSVYDGHQRLAVLKAAFGSNYNVMALQSSRPLTEQERQELTIAAHTGTVGQFNWDELANWDVGALQEWGMDAETLKGWKSDAGALSTMLEAAKPQADAEPQIDRAAELLEKWQVKTGDLWRIGEHRLLCGDSTKREDVERVMQGEKAGAVITDPPYGINREGIENDDPEGLRSLFDGCLVNMPIENAVIIAFQSPRMFPVWLDAIRLAGHKFERMLWMYKPNDVCYPWQGWLQTSEAILASSIGKPEFVKAEPYAHDTYISNWDKETKQEIDGWHASIKPYPLIYDLVSRTSGTVYEPFLGSGTTLVACQNLSRKCRGIEISPAYCAVTLERMATAFPGIEIERIDSVQT
jgi:hypothetical protein